MLFSRHHKSEPPTRRQRFRRTILKLVIAIGLFLALLWAASFYLSPQNQLSRADVIIVISGGQTTTRADEGIRLYQAGYAPKLIFSGAALDNGPSNARAMKEQALHAGVPDGAIETDETARTTDQNAINTKQLIDQLVAHSLILVTSPYHQRRAELTFGHVYGPSYTIINHSSFDNRWSKLTWWLSPFGAYITGSELVKIGIILATGRYQ